MAALAKWFRVAQSGKTIDGREISPAHVDQMAESYDPKKYGARIWCEHFRTFMPDGPFGAYGDVLAVKAETGPDGARVLLAQIDATEALIALAAKRQKVFFSIEIDPNFAGSGKAYLAGLAVTDSPASLGTDMLKFSLSSDKTPEAVKSHLFTAGIEESFADAKPADTGPSFLEKFKALLSGKSDTDAARFAAHEEALTSAGQEIATLKGEVAKYAGLQAAHDKLSADFATLKASLEKTPAGDKRPPHAGNGESTNATDC